MTGGPWTRSMKVVHGPGPRWESMDPWSMFCPHPLFPTRTTNDPIFLFEKNRSARQTIFYVLSNVEITSMTSLSKLDYFSL